MYKTFVRFTNRLLYSKFPSQSQRHSAGKPNISSSAGEAVAAQVTMAAASLRHWDALLSQFSDLCADKDSGAASGIARAVEAQLQLEQVSINPSAPRPLEAAGAGKAGMLSIS